MLTFTAAILQTRRSARGNRPAPPTGLRMLLAAAVAPLLVIAAVMVEALAS